MRVFVSLRIAAFWALRAKENEIQTRFQKKKSPHEILTALGSCLCNFYKTFFIMRCRGRKTHPDFQQIAESCLVWRHLHFLGSLWRRTDRSVCEQRPHSLVLLILQTLLCDTITAQERKFYRASKLPFQEPSWGRLVRNNGIVENGSNYHRAES